MAFALAKEQKDFIRKMVHSGRFNNQSEVVREALRGLARIESDYLRPPPLTPTQIQNIYEGNPAEDEREKIFGRASFNAVRRAAKRGKRL